MSWVEKNRKINNGGRVGGDDYSGLESISKLNVLLASFANLIIKT